MDKRFAAILVACVVALGGVFWFTRDKSTQSNTGGNGATLSNHTTGKNAKGVTLVEYGDFQCPACSAYHTIIKQVIAKYQDDISFQFRNFPLSQIHQNARAAARAAEAADKQGKYWAMHDAIYEQQQSWESVGDPKAVFESYAEQLGLDKVKFQQDYASSAVNETINADFAEGQKLGVDSTPSFFLQGKKLDASVRDLDGFSKVIDEAIKNAAKK